MQAIFSTYFGSFNFFSLLVKIKQLFNFWVESQINVLKIWEIFSTCLGQKLIKLPLYRSLFMRGGGYKLVEKRFPADVQRELKDKKVDAELYAYLQSVSYPENGDTIVKKSDLGTQAQICEKMAKRCQ